MEPKKQSQKGVTLIEFMFSITILAIIVVTLRKRTRRPGLTDTGDCAR